VINRIPITAKRDAANKGADYTYTGAGRLETRTWARGARTRYSYDQGMLSDVEYFTSAAETASDSLTPDLGYTYDAMGRLATVTRGGATHFTYTYSSTDLRLSTEIQNDAFLAPRLLTRKRDSILRPTGYKLGTTTDEDAVSEVTYGYDTAGRFSTVTYQRVPGSSTPPTPQTFTYGYNYETSEEGFHAMVESGGSPSYIPFAVTSPVHVAKRNYDPTRDVLGEVRNETLGTSTRSRYTYTLNALGQREGLDLGGDAFGSGTHSIAWTYDAKGQVTSANSTRGTSGTAHDRYFSYDGIGNRLESRTGTSTASGGSITAYFGNTGATVEGGSALNQYAAIVTPSDSLEPVHDDNGNLTSDGQTWNYAWDGENRMISATPVTPTSGLRRMTYRYDYLGRLASRAYASWNAGTSTWSDFENVRYIYDGWNRIDAVNWDNSIGSQHVWGLDLSGSMQGAGGVGGMLLWANTTNNGSTWALYHPTYDGNGNVSELVDGSGAVAEHWEYDAFGNTTQSTNSLAWNDPGNLFEFRFSTKPQDPQTGLYYYGYRFYDPVTGRWPSRDPIEEKGGVNLYMFIRNGGTDFIDYLGLSECYFFVMEDQTESEEHGSDSYKKMIDAAKKKNVNVQTNATNHDVERALEEDAECKMMFIYTHGYPDGKMRVDKADDPFAGRGLLKTLLDDRPGLPGPPRIHPSNKNKIKVYIVCCHQDKVCKKGNSPGGGRFEIIKSDAHQLTKEEADKIPNAEEGEILKAEAHQNLTEQFEAISAGMFDK
jgi:RHS repeat-associated protein